MLRVLGSRRTACDGVTRRDLLRIGGLGFAGATLDRLLAWQDASAQAAETAGSGFGRAKSVILIHLYGSPSQLETFDPKPDAPAEVRGEFGSIESSLPGCRVGELLPHAAQVMDRCTVLRSMTHPYPLHGVAYALTGVPAIDVPMELNPHDSRHWPYFGSVVDYLDGRSPRGATRPKDVPANIALPWQFSSRRVGEVPRAGPYAAFLGAEYNPVWTDLVGQATKGYEKILREMTYTDNDPYIGLSEDAHFVVPSATSLLPELTLDRLNRRRSLLDQLDGARRDLDETSAGRQIDRYQGMAYDLLKSDRLRTALDLRREPAECRGLYGPTLFGQACLAARRLVEAGTRVVSVFWDEFGLAGTGWDTHWDHFGRMKHELCPGFDVGWHGLIVDLERRGLLEDTLVICTSEHGRTPKISQAKGGGRDHWARAYSTLLAGAGIRRGQVLGSTDKIGGDVVERPISPKDVLATTYHLLGIDPHTWIRDAQNRPLPIVEGRVISEALV